MCGELFISQQLTSSNTAVCSSSVFEFSSQFTRLDGEEMLRFLPMSHLQAEVGEFLCFLQQLWRHTDSPVQTGLQEMRHWLPPLPSGAHPLFALRTNRLQLQEATH